MTKKATPMNDEELTELRRSSWPVDSNPHRVVDRLLATVEQLEEKLEKAETAARAYRESLISMCMQFDPGNSCALSAAEGAWWELKNNPIQSDHDDEDGLDEASKKLAYGRI